MQSQADQWLREGLGLHQGGRLEEAEGWYRRVLAERPGDGQALHLMGVLLGQRGDARGAVEMIRKAIAAVPGQAVFWGNLGKYLMDVGDAEGAIMAGREAVRLRPEFAEGHYNLGHALHIGGQLEEAAARYRQALEIKPGMAVARKNLGHVLRDLGQADEAIASYREALRVEPRLAEVHRHLGLALEMDGQRAAAAAAFQEALRLSPGDAEVLVNLGHVLHVGGDLDGAEACYREAIGARPEMVEAHNNLGSVLKDQGEIEGSVAAYRAALTIAPQGAAVHSNLILAMQYDRRFDQAELDAEARRWAQLHADELTGASEEHGDAGDPEKRLRVGYVSADFREHASAFFLMPLLRNHDRQQVEIVCYAEVERADGRTREFQKLADRWRVTAGVSDERVAEMVREDAIDVLVDLKLHTGGNRLLVFARRPAPVQVSWLGYPGATGMGAMDYRLTDRFLDPPGTESEEADGSAEAVRLPETFWCYDPLAAEESFPVGELPALKNGHVTFGCLNNFAKINREVLTLWARVLGRVADSRMIILAWPGKHRDRALEIFAAQGIGAERIEFVVPCAREEYLRLYQRIDVGLDTFPYNGHTTSLDALWMGVSVVSLIGRTAVGRGGLSQLVNLGLKELVAGTGEEYVEIAGLLARDWERLSTLRRGLRERMRVSPLMDARRFAGHLEAAYRQMWRKWCTGDWRQEDLS